MYNTYNLHSYLYIYCTFCSFYFSPISTSIYTVLFVHFISPLYLPLYILYFLFILFLSELLCVLRGFIVMEYKMYKCDKCRRFVSIRSTIKESGQRLKVCTPCYNKHRMYNKTNKPPEKQVKSNQLEKYFETHIKRIRHSEESGAPIYNPTKVNVCHLLPKRKYKSVAADLENCVYLTIDEHIRMDKLIDCNDFTGLEREFPNSWYEICGRVASVLNRTEEKGKLRTLWEEYLIEKGFID